MTEAERFLEEKLKRGAGNSPAVDQTATASCSPNSKKGETAPPVAKQKKGLAIASLVCAIVGGWASTASIPAVICGHMALNRINRNPNEHGGKGMAVAGLILGYFVLVLAILIGITRGYTNSLVKLIVNGQ